MALIIGFFLLGWAIHIMKKSDLTKRSELTPWDNLIGFLQWNWVALTVRFFLSVLGFILWFQDPAAVQKIFVILASYLADGSALKDTLQQVNFPLNAFSAGLYGYLADSLLDWLAARVPGLKPDLPSVEGR